MSIPSIHVSSRDVTNPSHDSVFHHLPPEAAHQIVIAIIFIAFWLGAVGWDIAATFTFDLRVLRETRYVSLFSICSSLAYLCSRYFTFAWLLRTLLDVISAVDDCNSRFKVSAVLYGFATCSTYLVFALRTANLWDMNPFVVGPLFVNLAAICGATIALGQQMQATRLGTSAFCTYTLKGVPTYIILCLCGVFDVLNFIFLGLKLNRSGWKGILRSLLPRNKPHYDHAEIRQMLLQRTGVFTLAQLLFYASVAVLYGALPDGKATYKIMQVAAFHGITCNMNSSIFRGAWKLTRECSPGVINTPPAYQSKWLNAPSLGTRGRRLRSHSVSAIANQVQASRSGQEKSSPSNIHAYVEGERGRDLSRQDRGGGILPRHRPDTSGIVDTRVSHTAAVEELTDKREDIRYDTILNQLSRGNTQKHQQQQGMPIVATKSLAYPPAGAILRSVAEGGSTDPFSCPGKSTTHSVATSDAGLSTHPGSSSASLVALYLDMPSNGGSRGSALDDIAMSSRPRAHVDSISTRPHTASRSQDISRPIQIIAPSSQSATGTNIYDRGEGKPSPNPPPIVPSLGLTRSSAGPSGGYYTVRAHSPRRSARQTAPNEEPHSQDYKIVEPDSDSLHRCNTNAHPPVMQGRMSPLELDYNLPRSLGAANVAAGLKGPAVTTRSDSLDRAGFPVCLSASRPSSAPTREGSTPGRASMTHRQRSTSGVGIKRHPSGGGFTSTATGPQRTCEWTFADSSRAEDSQSYRRRCESATVDEGRPRTSRGGPVAPFGTREPIGRDGKHGRCATPLRTTTISNPSFSGDSESKFSRPSTSTSSKRPGTACPTFVAATCTSAGPDSPQDTDLRATSTAARADEGASSAIAETYRQLEAMASMSSASSEDESSSSSSSSSSTSTAVAQAQDWA